MRPEHMKYLVLIINLHRNHISVQDGLYVFLYGICGPVS